jgi:hypothetical protein
VLRRAWTVRPSNGEPACPRNQYKTTLAHIHVQASRRNLSAFLPRLYILSPFMPYETLCWNFNAGSMPERRRNRTRSLSLDHFHHGLCRQQRHHRRGFILTAGMVVGMVTTIAIFAVAAVLLRERIVHLMKKTARTRERFGQALELFSAAPITAFGLWLLTDR